MRPVDLCVVLILAAFSVVSIPLAATAQTQDVGNMTFLVLDPTGAAIPDVDVMLAGPQVEQSAVTGSDGTARFIGLVPASYDATIAFPGFATLIRRGLVSSAGKTTSVRATLQISVEEFITVIGESPLLDVTTVNMSTTVTEELLAVTPTASGLWSGILDRVPGMVNSTIDVGGAQSGQQPTTTNHGSSRAQNQYTINGAQTTSLNSLGQSSMYYAADSFEEVAVSTAVHDVSAQTPGVHFNMVTKSGTNDVRGGARFWFANDRFVGDNVTPELEEEGVETGSPLQLLRDTNLQIGGPLMRDKLFTFVNYWNFLSESQIEDAPESERDDTRLQAWTVNTEWQMSRDHRLSMRYFYSSKFRGNRDARPGVPVTSARVQDPSDSHVLQANWQGVLSPTTHADVRVAYNRTDFALTGRRDASGNPHPDYPEGTAFTFDLARGELSGMPFEERGDDRLSQVSGNVTHYIGGESVSHSLQFGGNLWRTRASRVDRVRGGHFLYTIDGMPAFVDLYNTPEVDVLQPIDTDTAASVDSTAWGLYVQDSITFNRRLTLNLGLRFDHSSASIPEQTRLASLWAGRIPDDEFGDLYEQQTFPAQKGVTNFDDFAPRIAAIYDLTGTARTMAKASYGRYSMQQGAAYALVANPNVLGFNGYIWDDANRDGAFQFGEHGARVFVDFPGGNFEIDPDLRSPLVDEITTGIEHELNRDVAIGGTFIYRNTRHQVEDINTGVPYGVVAEELGVPDSFTPVPWLDPGPDGIPGTADDGGPLTVYNQDPSTLGQDFFLFTNVDKFGLDAPVRYRGVELLFRKRYADNWQALVAWTIGRSDSSLGRGFNLGGIRLGGSVFDNPNEDIHRDGLALDDRRHIVKASGSYLFESIELNIGANFRFENGVPALRSVRTPRGLLNQGPVEVSAAGRGLDTNPAGIGARLGAVTVLDVRIEKQFTMPDRWGRLSFQFDLFNLLNENAVRSAFQTSGRAYGRINNIVAPRMFRVGIGWRF